MAKRFVHLSFVVPLELAHDVELLIEGKAVDFRRSVVRHGGEDENGVLRAAPPVRDIILAFASSRDSFKPREVKEVLDEQGCSTTNVYTHLAKLVAEGMMKKFDDGIYALATSKVKKGRGGARAGAGRKVTKARRRSSKIGTNPDSVTGVIYNIVQKKQNGTGEGVSLDLIKDGVSAAGMMNKSKNISPMITDLVRAKKLVRVSPSHYRAVEA